MNQGIKRGNWLVERSILWFGLLSLAWLLSSYDWLWRWDQLVYDAQIRTWSKPAPDDIIIVGIDEPSLDKLGRWPWHRSTHAQLIEKLGIERARAIALDIIFAEPDYQRPQHDLELAQAIKSNGHVILPILMEQSRPGAPLVETLPIPAFADAAAGLGHVHVELDADGIARSVYLYEGLGSPQWPSLALALLRLADPSAVLQTPGVRNPDLKASSGAVWMRDFHMMIPFFGSPGYFRQISYVDVLDGRYPEDFFRNKIVLVGATATGLGDALPTPVSGHGHSMPGVEINAHILESLRNGINLRLISKSLQISLTLGIVLLPAFLYALLTPRWNLIVTVMLIMATLLFSTVLLRMEHVWFSPAASILVLLISYPLWSWRRLELAMRYLNQELASLHEERKHSPVLSYQDTDIGASLRFLRQLLPIQGWCLRNANGQLLEQSGNFTVPVTGQVSAGRWTRNGDVFWTQLAIKNDVNFLGLHWDPEEAFTEEHKTLLSELLRKWQNVPASIPRGTIELIQSRILQVQDVAEQLRELRQFVVDTISHMADAVLVVDMAGRIVLANERAGFYLYGDDPATLVNRGLEDIIQLLELQRASTWPALIREVLLQQHHVHVEVRHGNGRDLLVQIAPLQSTRKKLLGMIINLSDISQLKDSERKRAEVLGFLSHDLRSPLVSLLAMLEIARSKAAAPEVLQELQRMEIYTQDTLDLAEEFLLIAHAESGENIQYQDADLLTIARNAYEDVWIQAQKKHIDFIHETDLLEAWIRADARLIERALINLLTNAIKYSPDQGRVALRITRAGDEYCACIEDTGYGIDKRDLSNLFQRFQRSRRAERSGERGAGLGLAFVKTVADQHNGRVEVESTPGIGSRFCLCLPIQKELEHD